MLRWFLLLACCVTIFPAVAVEIADLPATCDGEFDLTWQMPRKAPAVTLEFTAPQKQSYHLTVNATAASWRLFSKTRTLAPISATLTLDSAVPHVFTFKRRVDTVALLADHRLVFTAPAPVAITRIVVPHSTAALIDARYHRIEPHIFGDDFMRPEAPKPAAGAWVEDPTWKVAYFRKPDPGKDPVDPVSKARFVNPWALSLFAVVKSSTNGFWFSYTGIGPSWVVANPDMVASSWDRYFVECAVYPEYDSTVGLIAAYQDNKNYLLFRWKARDYVAKNAGMRAQLVAIINGSERVLAENPRGFDPGQWYRLRINLSWQRAEVVIDGVTLLAAHNLGSVEGRIGLYASGVEKPRKPKLDEATATMFLATDEKTGKTYNDAADALSKSSNILFDDIRTGDWAGIDALPSCPYEKITTGKWTSTGEGVRALSAGKVLTGPAEWSRYVTTTRARVPAGGTGGLYVHVTAQTGYLWAFSAKEQRLLPVNGSTLGAPVDRRALGVPVGEWAELRVEADGPYIACFLNGRRVLEGFSPTVAKGRCGLFAAGSGVTFADFAVAPLESPLAAVKIHAGFGDDAWMVTWAGPEADWYPAVNHNNFVRLTTRSGQPPTPGPAAPMLTTVAGLYWNKGGYYGNLCVTVPVSAATMRGQDLHLSTNYDEKVGYRVHLSQVNGKGLATLYRAQEKIGDYAFALGAHTRLRFERRGTLLLLAVQNIDPEDTSSDPEVLDERQLFVYRDAKPLRAEMIGFTVTDPALPAAKLVVESNRIQDAFEESPVTWTSMSGIWAVMARYSCQPQWNWYGGFGSGVPTVWNKTRLDGDQNVEVYMGIKMKYDNMTEAEGARFRDMNVSICTDGVHLNSGYSLIRAGRQGNQPITLLLRKGVVVQSSTKAPDLIPGGGHRQWFAIRLEKRGGEIKVFIDNRLAMTYVDPEPLSGGYTAFWTLNNGIMIGRANLSAERMSPGTPRATAPLVVQEELPPLPAPTVTVNGQTVALANFETGFDGWQARPGLCGALDRERVTGPNGKVNTYLRIVNSYPAGDLSATLTATPVDLAVKPIFTCDYWFDKGAQVNLYARHQGNWYEFLMTGQEASEVVRTAGRIPMKTDGGKYHVEIDLGQMLAAAIRKATGAEPATLLVDEVIIADWSAPVDLRRYGFGANPGGTVIRFDNIGFLPKAR